MLMNCRGDILIFLSDEMTLKNSLQLNPIINFSKNKSGTLTMDKPYRSTVLLLNSRFFNIADKRIYGEKHFIIAETIA